MKKKKVSIISGILVLIFYITTINSYAYMSYSGALSNEFNYAITCSQSAYSFFSDKGYNPIWCIGYNFSRATVQNNAANALCFYEFSHGSPQHFRVDNGAIVVAADINNWRNGSYYKFVFLDSCDSGDSVTLANAFGIYNDDGLDHAFFGWYGVSIDNLQYANFTNYFFACLRNGKSVYGANNYASQTYGIYNGVMYGRPVSTYFN